MQESCWRDRGRRAETAMMFSQLPLEHYFASNPQDLQLYRDILLKIHRMHETRLLLGQAPCYEGTTRHLASTVPHPGPCRRGQPRAPSGSGAEPGASPRSALIFMLFSPTVLIPKSY